VVIVPISLLHELGHTAVCSVGGYQFRIWLDFRGGHSICYGILGNDPVIAAMGGIFGILTSLGILAIWYCFSKKIVALAVVSLALALDQGLKIFLEVFFPRHIQLECLTYSLLYCRLYLLHCLQFTLQGSKERNPIIFLCIKN
jgi:hypothetical protein